MTFIPSCPSCPAFMLLSLWLNCTAPSMYQALAWVRPKPEQELSEQSQDVTEDSVESLAKLEITNIHCSSLLHCTSHLIIMTIRLVRHGFPFVNPCWLLPSPSCPSCLEMVYLILLHWRSLCCSMLSHWSQSPGIPEGKLY